MGKTTLILGAGIGGVVAAKSLRKKLKREHQVILVDKDTRHLFQPSLLWVMLNQRQPHQLTRDLRAFNRKGIRYVRGEVTAIEPDKRKVKISTREFSYDYLIVALGAEADTEAIPGLSAAYNIHDLDSMVKLRNSLRDFSGGKVVIVVSRIPFKCPAAPLETSFLLNNLFKTKGIRDKVSLDIYTAEPRPMPVAGPAVGDAINELLAKEQIGYHPKFSLASVNAQKKELTFESGEKVSFDLLIAVPPQVSPKVIRESKLAGDGGWIPVNRTTLKTKYDDIFAIGDVAAIKLPGQYQPDSPLMLPKAGVFAHSQADVVAHNIGVEIKHQGSLREFRGEGSCFVELGEGKAAYAKGQFYATPHPLVNLKAPAKVWRWAKVFTEKYWFWRWF